MGNIFVPTAGTASWRARTAHPDRHWVEHRSAFELAVDWEAVGNTKRGLPPAVSALLDGVPEFRNATLLIGVPEHQVTLEGGGHASQTDLWLLVDAPNLGVVSVAVEAKAGEPFDKLVPAWLGGELPEGEQKRKKESGKPKRLQQICDLLVLSDEKARLCRYQLLHRAASAILEAQRFRLQHAMLLVQSFAQPDDSSLSDFQCFGTQLGVSVGRNQLVNAGRRGGTDLWLGWVSAPASADAKVRADARRLNNEVA